MLSTPVHALPHLAPEPAPTEALQAASEPAPLTPEQIAIVKSTAPVLKELDEAITTRFYANLLAAHPSLKNMFSLRNLQTGAQPKALAAAVLAYAKYVDNLAVLKAAVERIAHKHASLQVEPAQYAVVGEFLMGAIAEVLGDALTPEIADAWTAAYAVLANVFISAEAGLYAAAGWKGWKEFKIARREKESDSVASFYLEPTDGGALPTFLPGQYVSLRVPVAELDDLFQIRQFSLSQAPDVGAKAYRISVKRETIDSATRGDIEAGKVPGLVSNILHSKYAAGNVVELTSPQGEFFVDTSDTSRLTTPIVLFSAGVGATPMVSILEAVLAPGSRMAGRPVTWVQSGRTSRSLPFVQHTRKIASGRGNVKVRVFLGQVGEGDEQGVHYDFDSRLDLAKLHSEEDLYLGDKSTEYYICGPEAWMVKVRNFLDGMGVSQDRIHLELFGTGGVSQ